MLAFFESAEEASPVPSALYRPSLVVTDTRLPIDSAPTHGRPVPGAPCAEV